MLCLPVRSLKRTTTSRTLAHRTILTRANKVQEVEPGIHLSEVGVCEFVCEFVCEGVNADLRCKALWAVKRQEKCKINAVYHDRKSNSNKRDNGYIDVKPQAETLCLHINTTDRIPEFLGKRFPKGQFFINVFVCQRKDKTRKKLNFQHYHCTCRLGLNLQMEVFVHIKLSSSTFLFVLCGFSWQNTACARDATILNIILNRTVRHPRFDTHFEIAVFWFCIKFYVTSFNVFLPELALSELQSSP